MRKDIAVAQYTRKGDPLKIDCGYRPNGVIHLFHAVSLATDVNSAKVLAFSYSEMREGLQTAEHAMNDLTAITENELDLSDEGVAFALATLQGERYRGEADGRDAADCRAGEKRAEVVGGRTKLHGSSALLAERFFISRTNYEYAKRFTRRAAPHCRIFVSKASINAAVNAYRARGR